MISSKAEQLTAQFYEWELLGRGWLLGTEPVELEPPFTPFFGHYVSHSPVIDDGLRHTIFSRIISTFAKRKKTIEEPVLPDISHEPFPFIDNSPLFTLRLILSKDYNQCFQETEQLLNMLSYCTGPVSFEIIGTHEKIQLQFVCRARDVSFIKSQLVTLFPGISVIESETDYDNLIDEGRTFTTVDFGLKEEFMRPLSIDKKHPSDSFKGVFSILEHIGEREQAIIQVLFNGVLNSWESSIMKSVTDFNGESFFVDAPEMLPMTEEKLSNQLFATTIRILTQADGIDESLILLNKLSFALIINSRSSGNSLVQLLDKEYSVEQRIRDIVFRESHRVGMLLNTKELGLLVHLPDISIVSRKLLGETRKTKPAPQITEGYKFKLGQNIHLGNDKPITLSNEQRLKHTHIIGATGTGKSTLLLNMICQDIHNGEGVAVLDPHGDLIENVLTKIPSARVNDVVIIDPSDSDYPIGFNILKAYSDIEREILSSDLVAAFRKLSTSWGDQMNSVFANAILAFLESSKGGTLADMRRFLIEKSYREEFLSTVSDPNIIYYWQKEYSLLKTNSTGPILTRLDTFLRPRLIRNMVAQPKGVDFDEILNSKKILLVKLSQGLIGTENSFLLGTFVVSKIHQAALARQAREIRNDFFLYIDEFQHFITPSMSHILSGARKYHLGLILAHQDMQQLQKNDSELLNTLITNAGTRICFRVGDIDAKKLAEGFSFFEPRDLQNLNTGEAIVRVERPDYDFSLSTSLFESASDEYAEKAIVVNGSREKYCSTKQEVETMLKETMNDLETQEVSEIRNKDIELLKINQEEFKDAPKPLSTQTFKVLDVQASEALTSAVKKKEETQHRYLQTLIKKMAESKGYKAGLEVATPDGKGKVDVSIEGAGIKIACEVSVTTDSNWELHNIEKCLTAGYDTVFVCCAEKKSTSLLSQKAKERFDKSACEKIFIVEPEMLFDFLDKQTVQQTVTETKYKGYRVKVEYDDISREEHERKRGSVTKIVLESLRKMKK